jgi:hypothetical protein
MKYSLAIVSFVANVMLLIFYGEMSIYSSTSALVDSSRISVIGLRVLDRVVEDGPLRRELDCSFPLRFPPIAKFLSVIKSVLFSKATSPTLD